MTPLSDTPSTSLKSKAINGVGWSAADAIMGQGVTFLVGLVLARLLSPSEFGIIGIATILIAILTGFVDCGFSNALIRKKDVSDKDYNTMFITNLIMSIVIYAIVFISSPFIADFFEQQEVTDILRVLALTIIIQSVSLVQQTILTKNINFKGKAKATIFSATISGILGISAACSIPAGLYLRQKCNCYQLRDRTRRKGLPRSAQSSDDRRRY